MQNSLVSRCAILKLLKKITFGASMNFDFDLLFLL